MTQCMGRYCMAVHREQCSEGRLFKKVSRFGKHTTLPYTLTLDTACTTKTAKVLCCSIYCISYHVD